MQAWWHLVHVSCVHVECQCCFPVISVTKAEILNVADKDAHNRQLCLAESIVDE